MVLAVVCTDGCAIHGLNSFYC